MPDHRIGRRTEFLPLQFFDPKQERAVTERRLPHWSQGGTIAFITWRTWDSMPASVLKIWRAQRDEWLLANRIDPAEADWEAKVEARGPEFLRRYRTAVAERWNGHLDDSHGECSLRNPALAKVVSESLRHFDNDRYRLTDCVVMPNHVHLLASFPNEAAMLRQCESWKHFTAREIHRQTGGKGRFWQQDGFDHLVRSEEQFWMLRKYIAENLSRVGLPLTAENYYSASLTQ